MEKRQLNGLSQTSPTKTSADNLVVRTLQERYEYPALTSSPSRPVTLTPILHTEEGDLSSHGTETPVPTTCLDSTALTPPRLVMPNQDIACLHSLAPPSQHSTSNPPKNLAFGQGIKEALPYSEMAQSPYPPLTEPPVYNLAATSKATADEIHCIPSILAFIASCK